MLTGLTRISQSGEHAQESAALRGIAAAVIHRALEDLTIDVAGRRTRRRIGSLDPDVHSAFDFLFGPDDHTDGWAGVLDTTTLVLRRRIRRAFLRDATRLGSPEDTDYDVWRRRRARIALARIEFYDRHGELPHELKPLAVLPLAARERRREQKRTPKRRPTVCKHRRGAKQ